MDAADVAGSKLMDVLVFAALPFGLVHSDDYCYHRALARPSYAVASFDGC